MIKDETGFLFYYPVGLKAETEKEHTTQIT